MSPPESTIEEHEILDLLTALVDKSLVAYDESTGRYRLLETVRQYARDRLHESGDTEHWRERHLSNFLSLAEESEPHLRGRDQQIWLERLETEHDNLRAAMEWSSVVGGDSEARLRLAGSLCRFWEVRGYLGEGRGWLSGLLTAGSGESRSAARAKALNGAGALACRQGDYPAARAFHEESLGIMRVLGDRRGIANSLNNLGNVAHEQGDYPIARALHEESLAILRELGDRWAIAGSLNNLGTVAQDQGDYAAAWTLHEESMGIRRELGDRRGTAMSLMNLGSVSCDQGDYPAARALHDESLAIRRELGDQWGTAMSLMNLGSVAHEQGDYPIARALLEESLVILREVGDRRGIAGSLEGLAPALAALGSPDRAARTWGSAERLREEIGAPLSLNDRSRYERQVSAARAAMDSNAAFDAAWREGREMTMEQAIELALAYP